MRPLWEQELIREEAFRWLKEQADITGRSYYTREELSSFEFRGTPIPLVDRSRGIRNPADFDTTLSVLTSADRDRNPYDDSDLGEGYIRYSYRTGDGGDNTKLQRAAELRTPVIYFQQRNPRGPFYAHFPMYVTDDPGTRSVTLAFEDDIRFQIGLADLAEPERRYAEHRAVTRLHQGRFRDLIMTVYEERCSVCNLGHARLLDAAHITPDSELDGLPTVTNGLSLCKIHHAAYDTKLLGISPDYVVHVNSDLLAETDGPMLEHGLKEMHGQKLRKLPSQESAWPDQERLASRFAQFVA